VSIALALAIYPNFCLLPLTVSREFHQPATFGSNCSFANFSTYFSSRVLS